MTDKKKGSVSTALAAATCTLLGTAPAAPVQADESPGWSFDTALLYYGESDDRVQDASLNVLAKRSFSDEKILTLGLSVDALTGASPSGAIPQDFPQTFTRPSGNDIYTVPPGELPLDDTFRDTRVALSAGWEQPFARLYRGSVGVTASDEYDYTHIGLNAKLARDFNQRNTTLSFGVAFAQDDISPVGGTPAPLSPMLDVSDLGNRGGGESKDVVDAVIGVTQVVSRNLLVQLNYSYSDASGYLTDPYRILTLVDGVTGDAVPRAGTPGVEGPSHEYRFESRPDARTKHSVYGQAKYYWRGNVLDASYRYMTDDWEIDSHTLDLRFRMPWRDSHYIEPHFRYYSQSEADFFRVSLADNEPLPLHATNDYRLGNFDALTAGLKYGWVTSGGNEWSMRLEWYTQRGDLDELQLIGDQAGMVEYPDLDAVIFQVGYRFGR